jgi:hypothetical protein
LLFRDPFAVGVLDDDLLQRPADLRQAALALATKR